jgi:hypothetical protein
MRLQRYLIYTLPLLATLSAAQADTLLLESVAQSQVERPTRGMEMIRVEQRFGAPAERVPAVGEPPISRWVYPGYTVYFEGSLVLHSVIHRDATYN